MSFPRTSQGLRRAQIICTKTVCGNKSFNMHASQWRIKSRKVHRNSGSQECIATGESFKSGALLSPLQRAAKTRHTVEHTC